MDWDAFMLGYAVGMAVMAVVMAGAAWWVSLQRKKEEDA